MASSRNSEELLEEILRSFNLQSLIEALYFKLDRQFDHLVPPAALRNQVFYLIRVADQEGWLPELVKVLADLRPTNYKLAQLAVQIPDQGAATDRVFPSINIVHAGAKTAVSGSEDLPGQLYLLLLVDQFPNGAWGASIDETQRFYGVQNDPGSISVSVACALSLASASKSTDIDPVVKFREYLVSRRSVRGAYGMKRFIGSSGFPAEEILEHSRHTAAALRFFLVCDGVGHEYVGAALRYLLDRQNRTPRGLWVEQGERSDSRVEPITVSTLVNVLEEVSRRSGAIGMEALGTSKNEIDEALQMALDYLFEPSSRTSTGMWLYRYRDSAEESRLQANVYRYSSSVVKNIARSCLRFDKYHKELGTVFSKLQAAANVYGGLLPSSPGTSTPSFSATASIIECARRLGISSEFADHATERLFRTALDVDRLKLDMAHGWAALLSLAVERGKALSREKCFELQSLAKQIAADRAMRDALPHSLHALEPVLELLMTRRRHFDAARNPVRPV